MMKKTILIFLTLSHMVFGFAAPAIEKPTDIELQSFVSAKLKDLTSIRHFQSLYEDENWFVFGYIGWFKDARQGPRNIYVYVSKENKDNVKIRVHAFLQFPFSHTTYKEFLRMRSNPEPLDDIASIFAQKDSESFKRRFLNGLILDFALDDDFLEFFNQEKEKFYAFKQDYLEQLGAISLWNQDVFKAASHASSMAVPQDMLDENAEFKQYIDTISDIGIDGVLPYITDSECNRCFMMISSYSPSDNFSGYFWIEDESLLPPWDPNGVYYRFPLGDGWYIFRST